MTHIFFYFSVEEYENFKREEVTKESGRRKY